MAHLTCTVHGRRVHLSDSRPGVVMHHDASRCEFNARVTIGGNEYVPTILITYRDKCPKILKLGYLPEVLAEIAPSAGRKDRPRQKKTKK